MRRRSNRSSKAVEEPVETVSPRKSKRQTRRRKPSSSESDNEPISSLLEQKANNAGEEGDSQDSQEQVWKVAPSPQSATEGEVQKLKICLKRPAASPEKPSRTHNNSSSHEDDQPEENSRKSSRREKANTEEDNPTEDEIQEGIDEKGKLKGKSKSKTEKLDDSDHCIDEKYQNNESCDNISDNVQIDSQTVQSDNINTLTGKESEDIEIQREELTYKVKQEDPNAWIDCNNPVITVEVKEEVITTEETKQSEANSKSTISSDKSNESALQITPIPIQTIPKQVIGTDEGSEKDRQQQVKNISVANMEEIRDGRKDETKTLQDVDITESTIASVIENAENIPSKIAEKQTITNDEKRTSIDSSSPILESKEIDDKSDALNANKDQVIKVDNVISRKPRKFVYPKSMIRNTIECEEEKFIFDYDVTMRDASPERLVKNPINTPKQKEEIKNPSEGIQMYVAPPPRACVYPKSMLTKSTERKPKEKPKTELHRLALKKLPKLTTERKRKWGKNANIKDKLPELNLITTNLITEIYPNCKLLDEDEVKMNVPDVVSSPSPAKMMAGEKRKISIEMTRDPDPEPSVDKPDCKPTSEHGTDKDHVRDDRDKADQASIIALNRKISIVEDTAAKLKPPTSPSNNPVTAVLFINNLVRPFTLKQLKELLERTGKIIDGGFWTDRIKSKCFAHYESSEGAETTRNALHGVHWPIGNGKKLMIEFSTPEDFELARNPPTIPPLLPVNSNALVPERGEQENKEPSRRGSSGGDAQHDHHQRDHHREHAKEEEHRNRDHRDRRDSGGVDGHQRRHVREWDVGKGEEMRLSRSRSRDKGDKHGAHHAHSRSRRSASPRARDYDRHKPHPKVEEPPPQKLMDDLFLKTKTTPCIYWQALTPEEIALKQQQRLERMAEHQRRLQQSTNSGGGGLGSGLGYHLGPTLRGGGGYGVPYGGRRRY